MEPNRYVPWEEGRGVGGFWENYELLLELVKQG